MFCISILLCRPLWHPLVYQPCSYMVGAAICLRAWVARARRDSCRRDGAHGDSGDNHPGKYPGPIWPPGFGTQCRQCSLGLSSPGCCWELQPQRNLPKGKQKEGGWTGNDVLHWQSSDVGCADTQARLVRRWSWGEMGLLGFFESQKGEFSFHSPCWLSPPYLMQ